MSSRTGPFGSSSARGGNRRSPARSNEATGWTNATSSQAQTHYDSSPSPKPKRNARASTGRSAIIGNGSPLVHGDMFSRAGDLAWVRMCACPAQPACVPACESVRLTRGSVSVQASSLRSTGTGSGSPRSRRSPSRSMGALSAVGRAGGGLQRMPAVPAGWSAHTSSSGEVYYHNVASGISQWNWPEELPNGWEAALSKSTGAVYYINTHTFETQYARPIKPAAAAKKGWAAQGSPRPGQQRQGGGSMTVALADPVSATGIYARTTPRRRELGATAAHRSQQPQPYR
jgi:hypothetical protein